MVSIIIPVYNGAAYLEGAIRSALAQTWEEKEVIVVDDGSTDSSLAIARQFEANGVTIHTQANRGASAARNAGLALARGRWIQFLDADDVLHPDKLAVQRSLLNDERTIAICKTVHFFSDDLSDGLPDDEEFYRQYLDDPLRFLIRLYGGFDYWGAMIQPNAFLVPKALVDEAGPWNEALSLDDDGEFFCRVVLRARGLVYTGEGLNFYRKYRQQRSLSGQRTEAACRSQYRSICLKHRHLLAATPDPALIRCIHTATYKALEALLISVYPAFRPLQKEIVATLRMLQKPAVRRRLVFGGAVSNFIGNNISWRLLRQLQRRL